MLEELPERTRPSPVLKKRRITWAGKHETAEHGHVASSACGDGKQRSVLDVVVAYEVANAEKRRTQRVVSSA